MRSHTKSALSPMPECVSLLMFQRAGSGSMATKISASGTALVEADTSAVSNCSRPSSS